MAFQDSCQQADDLHPTLLVWRLAEAGFRRKCLGRNTRVRVKKQAASIIEEYFSYKTALPQNEIAKVIIHVYTHLMKLLLWHCVVCGMRIPRWKVESSKVLPSLKSFSWKVDVSPSKAKKQPKSKKPLKLFPVSTWSA